MSAQLVADAQVRIAQNFAEAEAHMNTLVAKSQNAATIEESIAAAKEIVAYNDSEYAYALYMTQTANIAETISALAS